ncbi:MAG: hypothetical protein ABIH34_05905, partial [Nanoarchaeota archaeon]
TNNRICNNNQDYYCDTGSQGGAYTDETCDTIGSGTPANPCSPKPSCDYACDECILRDVDIGVNPCIDGICDEGEFVSVDVRYTGICPANPWIQLDADNVAGDCLLRNSGGQMQGIDVQCNNGNCQGLWQVPPIHVNCYGEEAFATRAGIWQGGIGSGAELSFIDDPTGSVEFIPMPAPVLDSWSNAPDPVLVGNAETFTADWSGVGPIKIIVCKTAGLDPITQDCTGDQFCWYGHVADDPISCDYIAQASEFGQTLPYFLYICNTEKCSLVEGTGSFTVDAPNCNAYVGCYDDTVEPPPLPNEITQCYYNQGLPNGPANTACCSAGAGEYWDDWKNVVVY